METTGQKPTNEWFKVQPWHKFITNEAWFWLRALGLVVFVLYGIIGCVVVNSGLDPEHLKDCAAQYPMPTRYK